MTKTIRIAGATGYWGDSMMATQQFLSDGNVDYIVFDFLAEITMSIMARARQARPEMGYATDFISGVLKPHLKEIATQNIKIISNAGGVNPGACAEAARALAKEQGVDVKIAVVTGDDLMPQKQALADDGYIDMFSGAPFPPVDDLVSMNAYLGAFPIAQALADGADIIITGRCVDSAVTLGACVHEFGWAADDFDALAAASLAGHIIECGPQATGGNFTDWREVPHIEDIGYPFIDIDASGAFTVSKPAQTGGLVSVGTVSEQMLYEIGDPQAYHLPDVCCDFSAVSITQTAPDCVRVAGAKGYPPSSDYKVSATYFDGFRAGTMLAFIGLEAAEKAQAFADACLARSEKIFRAQNLGGFEETNIEIIGAASHHGAFSKHQNADMDNQEVVLKLAIKHADKTAAGLFLKEVSGMALATPAGLTMFAGARPKPSPIVRLFSFLIEKSKLEIVLDDGAQSKVFNVPSASSSAPAITPPAPPLGITAHTDMVEVPLVKLAWGRSGDKGDKANIGIIARQPDYLPYIWAALDEPVVASRFAHFISASDTTTQAVKRYYLPGSHAINYLIDNVLGGGGMASLRNDPQGKSYAQILLNHPVAVPKEMAETL